MSESGKEFEERIKDAYKTFHEIDETCSTDEHIERTIFFIAAVSLFFYKNPEYYGKIKVCTRDNNHLYSIQMEKFRKGIDDNEIGYPICDIIHDTEMVDKRLFGLYDEVLTPVNPEQV